MSLGNLTRLTKHSRLSKLAAIALVTALALGAVSCELDEVKPSDREEETFERNAYMSSIGNSLTAGFINGGLEKKGQLASFANLLARTVLERELQLPIVGGQGLGSESGFSPLFVDENGDVTREPLTQLPEDMLENARYPLPYDNLGVPGATTNQMLNTRFGDEVGNPFFDLILRAFPGGLPGGGTAIEQVERLWSIRVENERARPELITLWTGNNEVLGGALSGSPQSDDPGVEGYVVPVDDFEADFLEMIDRIEALDPVMIAVANVPPVTAIPYTRFFGTGSIPGVNRWNMEEDCDELGPGEECTPGAFGNRDDDPVQLVLLTAPISDCIQCYLPNCSPGTCDSIPANATLTFSEVELIEAAIEGFNGIIEREATARGWVFVDINAAFLQLSTDPTAGPLNVAFPWQVNPISGDGTQNVFSAFTLDGVHPSEKGHGEVANAFLTAINAAYGTTYPIYDLATIENVAGFERAPTGRGGLVARDGAEAMRTPGLTAEGRKGLQGIVRMLSARY